MLFKVIVTSYIIVNLNVNTKHIASFTNDFIFKLRKFVKWLLSNKSTNKTLVNVFKILQKTLRLNQRNGSIRHPINSLFICITLFQQKIFPFLNYNWKYNHENAYLWWNIYLWNNICLSIFIVAISTSILF